MEAGYFAVRIIQARGVAKRQVELIREVREILIRARAALTFAGGVQSEEDVHTDLQVGKVLLNGEPMLKSVPQRPDTEPIPVDFPLTAPQRRLLRDLALGCLPTSDVERLNIEITLRWLAVLGFVERNDGKGDYVITNIGRQILGDPVQRQERSSI